MTRNTYKAHSIDAGTYPQETHHKVLPSLVRMPVARLWSPHVTSKFPPFPAVNRHGKKSIPYATALTDARPSKFVYAYTCFRP